MGCITQGVSPILVPTWVPALLALLLEVKRLLLDSYKVSEVNIILYMFNHT